MLSSKDSRKTPQLGSDDLVPFDHVAAGHDGVRQTLSGSLIAKPCTRQEIEFYESSALHPAFQEFLPLYMGSLTSSEQQQPLAIAAAQESGALFLPTPHEAPTASAHAVDPAPHTDAASHEGVPVPVKEEPWVPSGGKKLETGLSIVLENVAAGFRRPNVLDVKLGARLWADDAPSAKRDKLDGVSKETTSGTLGYRIAGMKVWTGEDGEADAGGRTDPYATKYEGAEGAKGEIIEKHGYRRYDKWYGRSFNDQNVKQGFETFLAGVKAGKVDRSQLVAQRLAEELRNVQCVIEAEESRMYSASVLVVYEGDPSAMEHALEEEKKMPDPATQDDEEEDPDDFDFDEVDFRFTEDSLEPLDIKLPDGMPQLPDGLPQKAINISIDPETAQLPAFGSGEGDEDEDEIPKVHDLRLIDFAHAKWTPGEGPDENVLMGIRSLIKVFDDLAH